MKKLFVIVIALTAMCFSAKAQWYAGGSLALDVAVGGGASEFSFDIAPEAGYNFLQLGSFKSF